MRMANDPNADVGCDHIPAGTTELIAWENGGRGKD